MKITKHEIIQTIYTAECPICKNFKTDGLKESQAVHNMTVHMISCKKKMEDTK